MFFTKDHNEFLSHLNCEASLRDAVLKVPPERLRQASDDEFREIHQSLAKAHLLEAPRLGAPTWSVREWDGEGNGEATFSGGQVTLSVEVGGVVEILATEPPGWGDPEPKGALVDRTLTYTVRAHSVESDLMGVLDVVMRDFSDVIDSWNALATAHGRVIAALNQKMSDCLKGMLKARRRRLDALERVEQRLQRAWASAT